MELVDSKQKKLNAFEIFSIALANTESKYPVQVAMPAILHEFKQKNSEFVRLGNTIFLVHKGKDGNGFFKAYNADTARNFLESCRKFVVIAFRKMKMDYLVTEFQSPALERLFAAASKNFPMPNMAYKMYKGKNTGATRVVLKLGDRKKHGRSS